MSMMCHNPGNVNNQLWHENIIIAEESKDNNGEVKKITPGPDSENCTDYSKNNTALGLSESKAKETVSLYWPSRCFSINQQKSTSRERNALNGNASKDTNLIIPHDGNSVFESADDHVTWVQEQSVFGKSGVERDPLAELCLSMKIGNSDDYILPEIGVPPNVFSDYSYVSNGYQSPVLSEDSSEINEAVNAILDPANRDEDNWYYEPEVDLSPNIDGLEYSSNEDRPNDVNRRYRRKPLHPKKSPSADDPNFRGVVFTMDLKWIDGEWKLIMDKCYKPSKQSLGIERRTCRRRRSFFVTDSDGDDDEYNNSAMLSTGEKHCASCSVKKTPLWRDAEDGTPLCNACGIRYKKYRIRCAQCWHIPKKDEGSPKCKSCGSTFQYAHAKYW